jgi:hypothetical protein
VKTDRTAHVYDIILTKEGLFAFDGEKRTVINYCQVEGNASKFFDDFYARAHAREATLSSTSNQPIVSDKR